MTLWQRAVTMCIFAAMFFVAGCGSGAPDSFIQMTQPLWESVEIKQSLKFDDAWQKAVYIVTKKFEIDYLSKEEGFIRTEYGPSYFSSDRGNDKYKVRIIVKFTPDKKKLEFKIESMTLDGKVWVGGSDSRIAANMNKDFANSLGEIKVQPVPQQAPPKQ